MNIKQIDRAVKIATENLTQKLNQTRKELDDAREEIGYLIDLLDNRQLEEYQSWLNSKTQ